jgi:molybdopterin synthase catalytic subunit
VISVQTADFDPGAELERLRNALAGRAGAVVSFTGLVRDLNADESVGQLTLEHYPGMTEKALTAIEAEAVERWELAGSLIIHRIGPLSPGDRIVFVAAAAAHRKAAFRACEFMIDTLKTNAPFWKKEATAGGSRWLSPAENSPAG